MGISVLPVKEEGMVSGGHRRSTVTGHFQRQHLNTSAKKNTSASLVSVHLQSSGIKPKASQYKTHHCGCKHRSGV